MERKRKKTRYRRASVAHGFLNRGSIFAIATALLVLVAFYQLTVISSLTNRLNAQNSLIASLSNQISLSNQVTSGGLPLPTYNINSPELLPPLSLAAYPTVVQNQTFGKRLTGINSPLNGSELSVINNASDSYFEIAGEMLLNRTLNNTVGLGGLPQKVNLFTLNGKPSVIYLGSITCIFCGENRWAMALALGRFGTFGNLFKGYSSFGDGNLPTLYWRPMQYTNSTVGLGSFYNSSYINFLPIEDTAPITGGFVLQPLPAIQHEVNSTGNPAYTDAMSYILQINTFQGTPYTIWGKYVVGGADAVDFGNAPPQGSTLPLTNMTHQQVLAQLAKPSNQFAWTEYAGADVYIALMCGSLNNTAPICSIPVIPKIESSLGVGS
jgi:hypothetical protein